MDDSDILMHMFHKEFIQPVLCYSGRVLAESGCRSVNKRGNLLLLGVDEEKKP